MAGRLIALLTGCALLSACAGGAPSTAPSTSPVPDTGQVPRPDHVVIVVEENHAFGDVIGSAAAPYFASLAAQGALFTQSFALTHPSQPNYLALFSGSTQGVSDDSCPQTFNADNLGHQLLAAKLGFTGYSEDLPAVGSTDCFPGEYDRDHNPWVDFTDLPASTNQPFSAFPTNYATLPAVSFVMPNLDHDMHNGTVAQADSWLKTHLDAYVRWARTHNSLLIVTGDEDDGSADNRVATIFVGAQVKPGSYGNRIDHYSVLRTIEKAYGLPLLGSAADARPITEVWVNSRN
ncbi:MAG TPA: alkaline phosphatase family protein [Pseudonocardiaceae bacterium]|nr:alkaline phosphatase family protein [Pseudonocardiaceae bacterium]